MATGVLAQNQYFVKEHVGFFKAANNYDILDPATGQVILECREPALGAWTKLLRFTQYKVFTPFNIEIRDRTGQLVCRVKRGATFIKSTIDVFDGREQRVGGFKQKLWSIGGAFDVLDERDQAVCTLKGKWTTWEYRFLKGETELAKVTKKWAGIGKELFTSADNYMLDISPSVPADGALRLLILGSVMSIDMVFKERR
jgi:uncharacterized protein YxjI